VSSVFKCLRAHFEAVKGAARSRMPGAKSAKPQAQASSACLNRSRAVPLCYIWSSRCGAEGNWSMRY